MPQGGNSCKQTRETVKFADLVGQGWYDRGKIGYIERAK